MFKKLKIKKLISLLLVFLLSINSFISYATSNDGSSFITKAEFDSLKNTFQSQLDEYNKGIDSKIDAAISAYLHGGGRQSKKEIIVKNSNLVWPLTVKRNSDFTNYTSNINADYDYFGTFVRGVYNGQFHVTGSRTSGSTSDTFYVVDDDTKLLTGTLEKTTANVAYVRETYRLNSSMTSWFWWIFLNFNGYKTYGNAGKNGNLKSYEVDSTIKGIEKIYCTKDGLDNPQNTWFFYGQNPGTSKLYWDHFTSTSTYTKACVFFNEASKDLTHLRDERVTFSGNSNKISFVSQYKNNVYPVLYFDNIDQDYYSYFLLKDSEGYVQDGINQNEYMSSYKIVTGVEERDTLHPWKIMGFVWPGLCLFDQTNTNATSRNWYECSGVKANDIKYQVQDTMKKNVYNTLGISEGLYLATIDYDGSLDIKINVSDTGSNNKKVILAKVPIEDDGSTLTAADRYMITSGAITSTSIDFAGTQREINVKIPDVKSKEKVFVKILCDTDYQYEKAPEVNHTYYVN